VTGRSTPSTDSSHGHTGLTLTEMHTSEFDQVSAVVKKGGLRRLEHKDDNDWTHEAL